jgi:PHD/YefM family antitoxin component YafN of YafNO toxin-antitoxin module
MNNKITKNLITIPKPLLKKQGIVVLSLEEYERMKEDFEMLQSKNLAKEIAKARKEIKQGKTLTLEEVKKELNL